MENKGKSLFLSILFTFLFTDIGLIELSVSGAILYSMILARELTDEKKENDKMKLIDDNFFSEKSKDFEGPLDSFVEMCLNEVLILSRGWKQGQYITKNEENQIMQDMIDSMARNMGPILKKKLELYYGPRQVDSALVRKAYIKVSLYVAEVNKVLYVDVQKKPKGGSLDDMLRDAMMMQGKVPK